LLTVVTFDAEADLFVEDFDDEDDEDLDLDLLL
jgi:hypothetical protein